MEQVFRIGAGRREITPPLGSFLAGYSPMRPARTVLDPLHVIAILIEQGDRRVLFASMDLCNPGNAGTEIRRAMAEAAGVPFENTFYSATHTHSGPVVFVTPPFMHPNPEYVFGTLIPRAAEAAREAAASLKEAQMGIGTADSQVGINRRQMREDGSICLGQEPLGLYDPKMTVVSFRDRESRTICNLIHYGCHNTASGKNDGITRDWCGYMKDALEAETGGITAFFNGCEGDCGPRLSNGRTTGTPELARELGGIAAADACRAWHNIREWKDQLPLQVFSGTVTLPYEPLPSLEELEESIRELGDPEAFGPEEKSRCRGLLKRREFRLSGQKEEEALLHPETVFSLGDLAFVPSPFESFAQMTMRISRHSPFAHTLVVSQTNERLFYLPTRDQIPLGGYEVQAGVWEKERPFVPEADQYYVEGTLKLLRQLKGSA